MSNRDNFTPFMFGILAGFVLWIIILAITGNWPGDAYQRGVRDHASGRATIEIQTDTIVHQ